MANKDELSMQTDNTAKGDEYGDTVEGGPVSQVMIGDRVVDSTGKEVGKVKFAKMGDPTAATTRGQWTESPSFFGWADGNDFLQLPAQAQGQLMRVGFIHIDISFAPDKYAGAGQIDRVEGNTVYLNVPEANLI